jgi:hypothetical protein
MIGPAASPAQVRPVHGGYPAPGPAARPSAELIDVFAYLGRMRANAAAVAERSPESETYARWTMRTIDVLSGDLRAGFHHGAALAAAVIDGRAA